MRTVPILWYTSAVDALLSPFELPYVQRGLAEILLLSVGAGVLGCWIVLRGLAFYSHAVGTAAFPGLVLADGLGFAAPLGAIGAAAAFALVVTALGRRTRVGADATTAIALTGMLALGVILASDVFESGPGVESLLFGSLLLVEPRDLLFAGAASAIALAATTALGRRSESSFRHRWKQRASKQPRRSYSRSWDQRGLSCSRSPVKQSAPPSTLV